MFVQPPLPTHECAIESHIVTWKCGPRFSIFFYLSGQVAFIHLLTHQNHYFTPALYSQVSITSSSLSGDNLSSNFTEKVETIRNDFPEAPITISAHLPVPASVPRCLPFYRWIIFLEKKKKTKLFVRYILFPLASSKTSFQQFLQSCSHIINFSFVKYYLCQTQRYSFILGKNKN